MAMSAARLRILMSEWRLAVPWMRVVAGRYSSIPRHRLTHRRATVRTHCTWGSLVLPRRLKKKTHADRNEVGEYVGSLLLRRGNPPRMRSAAITFRLASRD